MSRGEAGEIPALSRNGEWPRRLPKVKVRTPRADLHRTPCEDEEGPVTEPLHRVRPTPTRRPEPDKLAGVGGEIVHRALSPLALLLAIILASAITVASATSYPLTVVDDLGRDVTLVAAPQRIVAMAPSHSESVCALDACQLVVGADRHSDWPLEVVAVATLGDAFAPDLEGIVALEPDLVLVDEYSGLHEPLAALGITVYAGTPQTFEETLAFLGLLGEMLDREDQAALLVGRVRGEIAGVEAVVAGAHAPTVFVELDPTPYSVGPDSFLGVLLSKAGGANIVTSAMGDFPLVDPEFVVASDPEVILLADAPFGVSAEDVAARPGWAALRAVVDGRVVEFDLNAVNLLSRAGPRMGEAVLLLARTLHPGLF